MKNELRLTLSPKFDLTLQVMKLNENLLIMGSSSTGKSSLLRLLQGLWPIPDGAKIVSGRHDKIFLPQVRFQWDGVSVPVQAKTKKGNGKFPTCLYFCRGACKSENSLKYTFHQK